MKLVDEGKIRKAMVGMYLNDNDNSHLILGDYDASFIEGGEDSLKWLETTNDTEWQIAVTSAYFGDHNLYKHSFRQAVLHSGTELLGVIMADFSSVSKIMMEKFAFSCDKNECVSKKSCDKFNMEGLDFNLTLGPDVNVKIPGSKLLIDKQEGCQFALFNSGKRYIFGNVFLKEYYTIYDI